MKSLMAAVGQTASIPGQIQGNLAIIARLATEAAAAGARVILTPEASITGYDFTPATLALAEPADGSSSRFLRDLARDLRITIAAGMLERDGAALYICHLIAQPDGNVIVQRKHGQAPIETRTGITPGPQERIIFEVDGVRCAVVICADMGIPDIRNKLAAQGCQLMLVPTAGGGPRDTGFREKDLEDPEKLKRYQDAMSKVCFPGQSLSDCYQHQMAMAATNLASGDDGIAHWQPGHSMIVDSTSQIIALIPGSYVQEHVGSRWVAGVIHASTPRVVEKATATTAVQR